MNERPYTLTDDEANAIKDVLKVFGTTENRKFVKLLAQRLSMSIKQFDALLDSAFIKLGNGRVTIIES